LDNTKPLVVVVSRNYSTGLGVIRSLGEAGYTVDLIASVKKPGSSVIASSSKYVRKSVEVLSRKIQGDTGDNILEALMEYARDNSGMKVLFPADDFTTSVVDRNREALNEYFVMPVTKCGKSITECMDKTFQSVIAEKVGLLTPAEWNISLTEEIKIPEDMIYPCFVKPVQSFAGHKTEMTVCYNKIQLHAHLLEMKSFYADRDVLVQEFLNIDKEIDLSGVCDDQKIMIPAVIEKTHIAEYERGVTMSGKLVATEELGETADKIIKMMQQFRYIGMFDMELNICGDKVYFNEVNFRSGGPNYSYQLNGVNIPDIFVKAVTGTAYTPEEATMRQFGKTFVYEKVAWEDYIHGFMTKSEMHKCINEADYTLLANDNDENPGKIFFRRIRLSALKNRIKGSAKKSSYNTLNNKTSKTDIVVAGRNYGNILTMVRAFGKAGYESDVLRIYKKRPARANLLAQMTPDEHSKYIGNFEKCIVKADASEVVAAILRMADENNKKVLLPVDDYTVCVVDEYFDILKEHFYIPSIKDKAGEISRFMDKYLQKEHARVFDLPMLQSWLIKSENGEFDIPDGVKYPCFIKPNVSMKSTKSTMAKCSDREELKVLLTTYAQKEDFEMLVEEFADIKQEYSILGISTPDRIAAPCVFKATEGGHKERKGVAIKGETVSSKPYEEIITKSCEFIKTLGYTGIFDIDIVETTDGKIYFIELNFRAGASTHVFTESGINLPGMLADYYIYGKELDSEYPEVKSGVSFLSEKVLLEEFARSDANISKLRNDIKTADICFIKDEHDPQPYKYFKKYYKVAWLMRLPYKLRDYRKGTK